MHSATTKRNWNPPIGYDQKPNKYTPLAASIEHIYEVNKEKGLFKNSAQLFTWQSRDKKKYYD